MKALLTFVLIMTFFGYSVYVVHSEGCDSYSISEYGLEMIKNFEGFSPNTYRCPSGFLTVGYGHRTNGYEWMDLRQAHSVLLEDINKNCSVITEAVKVPLKQNQYDALCSLAFNIGPNAFKRSKVVQHLNNYEFDRAAHAFRNWTKPAGLANRREAEINLFLS